MWPPWKRTTPTTSAFSTPEDEVSVHTQAWARREKSETLTGTMPRDDGYSTGDKFVRVIELLQRLTTTRRGLTTAVIAEDLGITTRSTQRYVKQLREQAGLDIVEDAGRLRLGEGSKLPPMQFDAHQATALLIAARLLQQMRPGRDPAVIGAVGKLAAAMRLPAVSAYLASLIEGSEKRPADATRLQIERTIVEGFAGRMKVEIAYGDGQGAATKRVIHPYFLEPRPESRTVYVFAHDEQSGSRRTFRLDRITQARVIRETFTVPDDFDINAVVAGSWGIWQSDGSDRVVLRFQPEIVPRVKQSVWHLGASVVELSDGRAELTLTVSPGWARPSGAAWQTAPSSGQPGSKGRHPSPSR